MPVGAKKPQLIAVDSNVLLDRAADDEMVLDACDILRHRLPMAEFILTPTVLEELVLKAEHGDTPLDRRLARKVLANLLTWRVRTVNFIPVGRGSVAEIARKIRRADLIPDDEVNDSLIVAEAGLVAATLLLSSDAHIKDLDQARLTMLLAASDVSTPLIAAPAKIVRQFYT
jgi:predicted nucleic-acid-binding protein